MEACEVAGPWGASELDMLCYRRVIEGYRSVLLCMYARFFFDDGDGKWGHVHANITGSVVLCRKVEVEYE